MAPEPPKYLPEDVMRIIFSRVPVKYVIRCRCVCKTWYQIIGSRSFVKAHLTYQNSASNSNKYMLYQVGYLCTLLPHSHSIYDTSLNYSKLYNMKDILRRYEDTNSSTRPRIYGICNGLLCLSNRDYEIGHNIYLWNPTCRKIKKLPQTDNNAIIKDAARYDPVTSLSFGYYDGDFKVIAIAIRANAYFAFVYSLNINSWNVIQHHNDFYIRDHQYYRCNCVHGTRFVDGTVYIIESDHVRCFDLSNETIQLIRFPKELGPCVHDRYTTNFNIEIYGDSIAIFKFKRQSQSLTMWILKEKSSFVPVWEKRLDNIESYRYYLVGLLNNGKYLVNWKQEGPKKCYLCDLDSPRVREVTFMRGSPYIYDSHIHPNYVESLLLLNEDHLDPIVLYDINGNSLPESAD